MSRIANLLGSAALVIAVAAFAAPVDAKSNTAGPAKQVGGGKSIQLATSCKDPWYTMSGIQYLTCLFSGQMQK
ncbi:hypothetical protein [Arenimonas oryziterrae]|uniref:Uncharacterized protein n=1 Tax=Arenimonas oryziterrae DSM 21050 = YC6267 TaxID=1121015 RepID=A0A091AU02_9GAMM|nr:hypothetical protein [Arenimonas oryziterrae]KFN43683.1 hypothetical protein N789_10425 [Arenimonas oryziterrae DSM 21050 = YC6267]